MDLDMKRCIAVAMLFFMDVLFCSGASGGGGGGGG